MTDDEIIDELFRTRGRTVRDYFPRRILTPVGFKNPDSLYRLLASSIIVLKEAPDLLLDEYEAMPGLVGSSLAYIKHPMFFIEEDLIERLSNTDLPKGLRFDEFKLPHMAFTIAVPIGWSIRKFGVELQFISVALGIAAKEGFIPVLIGFGTVKEKNGVTYEYKFKTPMSSSIDAFSNGSAPFHCDDEHKGDNDRIVQWKVIELACQVLLYMNTIKDSIPKDVIQRPAKRSDRKGKSIDELWAPNILKWTSDRVGSHESVCGGISPRTHWRRGHFRAQRCGSGLKDVKTIWIQPVLVNKDKSDPNTFST